MEENSVYLDGYCRGPHIDNKDRRYSFDHHSECGRFETLSTCEQVLLALDLGFDPSGLAIYINDLDGDGSLSLWLLCNPSKINEAVREQVRLVGRVDAHGPVWDPTVLHKVLYRNPREAQTMEMLREDQSLIDTWFDGGDGALPEPFTPPVCPVGLGIHADGSTTDLKDIRDFADVYAQGLVVAVLGVPGPGGTQGWTIGKKSDFVSYDIPAFLARANEVEPGWGGGSTIGGAPRNEDGTRSRLSIDRVRELFHM